MMDKHITIINNINTNDNKVNDSLLADLLLEMGVALGFDFSKPVTAFVSTLSHKDDAENECECSAKPKYKS